MVVVVKIAGIPWFNALEKGVVKGGGDFKIDASMVGPANVDPAQQVKLLEDLIAKKVNVIGLVPLDVKVTAPVLKRAQEAGIKVITHEGPEQEGRDWNVELIDSVKFGEVQMERLAKDMGEEGEYVVYVGTLTTPLHNKWADAAIAYRKEHYPKMKLVADRFPGADEIDTSYKTTLDVIKPIRTSRVFSVSARMAQSAPAMRCARSGLARKSFSLARYCRRRRRI